MILTDGSMGGEGDDLVQVRLNEVHQAAESLGVNSLHTWSERDRSLSPSEELINRTSSLILKISPSTVFFPGPLEIHPDHRAASVLVWKALQKVKLREEAPTPISYEIGVQNPVNLLIDVTQQIAEKKKVMEIYVSQNKENNYPELVLALDKGRTFSLPRAVEFAEGFFEYQVADLNLSLGDMTHAVIDLYGAQG